jgi:hypothetical protein
MSIVSKREIIGCLIAPLIAPIFMCLIGIPELMETEPLSFATLVKVMQQYLVLSMLALPVAYGVVLAFGLPAYYVFKKYNLVNAKSTIGSAAVIGTLPPLGVLINGGNFGVGGVLIFTAMGACIGSVYWLIIRNHITKPSCGTP